MTRAPGAAVTAVVLLAAAAPSAHASLSRGAAGPTNMGEAGAFTVDTAAELARDPDGRAWLVETGVQVEVTDRLQLLVEAALYERDDPDGAPSRDGLGDTDVTVSWLAVPGHSLFPAIALGGKVKLPTAPEGELGTGRADWSALAAAASELGELELNLELEAQFPGSPAGVDLRNRVLYTFSAELSVTDALAAYVEASGEGAPADGEDRTDAALAGLEVDVFPTDLATPYASVEFDTEETLTARAGVEWSW